MRKFLVNVNGTSYEVEVEELKGDVKPAAIPAPAAPQPVHAAPGAAEIISAPMPGTIVGVNVKVGDSFKRGQVLLVLEAMKMENEILAPRDGRVVNLNTQKGASVNSGDVLIAFE
ncbi:MAG: biotin/lipoyl-binding protein [Clostridia bacterium]|jgi:biotin carboxyl carrier protein|nr:biotin/lipoyl-binding protein [Clostridia bacterium]